MGNKNNDIKQRNFVESVEIFISKYFRIRHESKRNFLMESEFKDLGLKTMESLKDNSIHIKKVGRHPHDYSHFFVSIGELETFIVEFKFSQIDNNPKSIELLEVTILCMVKGKKDMNRIYITNKGKSEDRISRLLSGYRIVLDEAKEMIKNK